MKIIKKALVMLSLIFTLIGLLTFAMTYQNIGFNEQFFEKWLTSTLWSATTMAPLGFIMIAIISKLVSIALPKATESRQNFVIGVSMAVIMESIMTLVTTINNIDINTVTELTIYWWQAFVIALPLGLLISLIMSLFVKPRLDRYMAS
jgi:hypothetical protein